MGVRMGGQIGLILNPMAGRDIRRVVAAASLQSGPEKLLMARRILAGLAAVPDTAVLLVNDYDGFGRHIAAEWGSLLPIHLLGLAGEPSYGQTTAEWVHRLQDAGAQALVVVGGDGTQRNVAQAQPAVPVLPVAGGTNNVACWIGDQTAAGYAAAVYVRSGVKPADGGYRAKVIHAVNERGQEDIALIDVALVRQNFTGALAVWDPEDVEALVLTVADPVRPGLSNVGGQLCRLTPDDEWACAVDLAADGDGTGEAVPGVLAPGLMTYFRVRGHRRLALGATVELERAAGGSLALDGERTMVLRPHERAWLTVRRDGPFVLDPVKILEGRPLPEDQVS